jgi:hypothetical protein
VADNEAPKVHATGEAHMIEPKTFEEAMAQNERLRAVVAGIEAAKDKKAGAVFFETTPKGFVLVVCAPTCDEHALAINLRHAMADLAESFLGIGHALGSKKGATDEKEDDRGR